MHWGRRKFCFLFCFGIFLLGVNIASGQEARSKRISFNIPRGFYQQVCPSPIWSGVKVKWEGMKDARSTRALGVVTKKRGKDPIQVYSVEPVAEVLNLSLKQLFNACGMTLLKGSEEAPPGTIILRGELKKFDAKEEKAIFTGKGMAEIQIVFYARRPAKKITADVGYQLEFKLGRKRGIQRLQEILQELYLSALKGIPQAPSFEKALGLSSS